MEGEITTTGAEVPDSVKGRTSLGTEVNGLREHNGSSVEEKSDGAVNQNGNCERTAKVEWDRVETEFVDETQKFSLQSLHRAQTLFSVLPSATATCVPSISTCCLANTVLLCVDNLLHIFDGEQHVAALELDSVAEQMAVLDLKSRVIVLAKRNGEIEILTLTGSSLFSHRLMCVDDSAEVSATEAEDQRTFLSLEATPDALCLLTKDFTLFVLKKKADPSKQNGDSTADDGDAGQNGQDDAVEEEGPQEQGEDTTNDGAFPSSLRNLLDISSFSLTKSEDIDEVTALVMIEDFVVFASGSKGALHRLDLGDGSLTRLCSASPGDRVSNMLAGGDRRYIVLLYANGSVALLCTRSFLIVDFFMDMDLADISFSQMAEEDVRVVKVLLAGYHSKTKRIALYSLPTLVEEYAVELGGRVMLVKQCAPSEELIVVQVSDDLSNITVKSINESSPQTKLDCLLLKKKYDEAEQLAKMFRLPLQNVYLEEFYSLLNQLGREESEKTDGTDPFERLLELYQKIDNPVEVYHAVINSLPAKLEHAMKILELLAADLQRNHNGNGSSNQLADVVLSQYKLTTFKLVEEEHSFQLWSLFLRTPTLDLIIDSLRYNQNSRALTIWSRHRDMICGNADLKAMKRLIAALPLTIEEIKRWLVEGRLLAYFVFNFAEAVDDFISRIVETATIAESREPQSWPLASRDLLNKVQSEFDSILLVKSNSSMALPAVINAMKMFQGLKVESSPIHRMAKLRKDLLFLIELRQKYNVRLTLEELSSLPETDLMFAVMNHLSTEMEIHNFIQCTLKDVCLKKGLDLNDMLLEYIAHLRTFGGSVDSSDWELKACRVFKLLAVPEFMSKAALTIVEAAAIPWKQCVHEVYDIAVGMDFLHREKLERLKKDIPLKLLLKKYDVPLSDLDEEDIIIFLVNAGELLEELLRVSEQAGLSRDKILVEFLLKYCEDEDADALESFLKDYHEELIDPLVQARLQFMLDTVDPRTEHAALLRYALSCCSKGEARVLPTERTDSISQILSELQGQTPEEIFCELTLHCYDSGHQVDSLLLDLLVQVVSAGDTAKLQLIAECFLLTEINERICLLAVRHLLAKSPVIRISNVLEHLLTKCNLRDAGYGLYQLWISTLTHFNLTTSNDPFVCWKFSADISVQHVTLPATTISAVDSLVNGVFDEEMRTEAPEEWLDKILMSLRQCCDELQRVPAIQLVYELMACIRHTLVFFDMKEPASLSKMAVDSAKSLIREHISSKYSDLFYTAHVLAELGSDLLVQFFQSILAHSLSNTTMVIKLASVGLLVSDMHNLPGKNHLTGTLKASEWCLKLADYQIDVKKIVKEGFNQRNSDEVVEKLTQSSNVDIDLLKRFAQDFPLGSLSLHTSKLFQHLLTSAVDKIHRGSSQVVYLEMLPKADSVLGLLSSEEAFSALKAALPQIDDYCYELLQYIYEKLQSLGHDQQKELLLVLFLKGYRRKSKISTKESLHWTILHPEYCALPDLALKRIPLRLLLDKPEEVLAAELNATNIDDWISVCHLIRKLSPDDMRLLALTNSVKQYKQRASMVSCDEKLVGFFMKLVDDMTDEKKALSNALSVFNDLPKGKTKVRIARELYEYANDCMPSMAKIAQTFYSQYRALGCEMILRENSFEENGLLKRCSDPNDLVATVLGNKLNTDLSLDVGRVLPLIEHTATLAGVQTTDFLVHFIKKWLNDNQSNVDQSEMTATFNFNQIMNGASTGYANDGLNLDDVIRVVRLLVTLPPTTAEDLVSHILALQNSTHTLAADQQLRTNLAILCAFDEKTASSLLGSSVKIIVRQCNQLMYSSRIQRHGVPLNAFLSTDELVRQVVDLLVQRNQRDSLVLAFHIFRDFAISDDRTLSVIVDGVASRADIIEEAVLFLQRFRSVFGQPEFVQCWNRVAVVRPS